MLPVYDTLCELIVCQDSSKCNMLSAYDTLSELIVCQATNAAVNVKGYLYTIH